jgi:hypothetical protein
VVLAEPLAGIVRDHRDKARVVAGPQLSPSFEAVVQGPAQMLPRPERSSELREYDAQISLPVTAEPKSST